jgi:toxin ParE1/3/4
LRRLIYLPSARRDLLGIADYLTETSGSLEIASRIIFRLEAQCEKLARLPATLGRPRPDLRPDLRSFPYRGYLILFRYRGDALEIVNIVEGHRDVTAHVANDDSENG